MESHSMQSSYVILAQHELVIETITGRISLNKIKTDRDLLYCDKDFRPEYKMIIDARDVEMHLSYDEFSKYIEYLAKHDNILKQKETTFLTKEDLREFLIYEFKTYELTMNVNFYTFLDTESCVKWLNNPKISKTDLDKILLKLKNEPSHFWFKTPSCITGF